MSSKWGYFVLYAMNKRLLYCVFVWHYLPLCSSEISLTVASFVKLLNTSCNYTSIIFDRVRGRAKWIIPGRTKNVRCEKLFYLGHPTLFRTGRQGPPVHKCNAPVPCQTWELSLAKLTVFFNDEQFDQEQLSLLDKTDASEVRTDWSSRPVLTKLKRPYSDILAQLFCRYNQDLKFR